MGYHDAVNGQRKMVKDAVRFLNDRARYKYALSLALGALGMTKDEIEVVIADAKVCNFELLERLKEEKNEL